MPEPEPFCPDTHRPCARCPFCQGEACARCGPGPCDHDVLARHDGALPDCAPGM